MLMNIEITSTSKTSVLIIQQLVKRFDGRFLWNPYHSFGYTVFKIGFDDGKQSNKFCTMLRITEQSYF